MEIRKNVSVQTDRRKTYSLLLLAGGRSRRMGCDKAELSFDGKTFLSCMLDKAGEVGITKKYLSGHCWTGKGVNLIPDIYRNRGPLGGIHACLLAMSTPFALVLPVDIPQISPAVLDKILTDHERLEQKDREKPFLLAHGGRTEPLIGIYPVFLGKKISHLIENGPVPVFRLLDETGYGLCRISDGEFQAENINTPRDYQMLLDRKKEEENNG